MAVSVFFDRVRFTPTGAPGTGAVTVGAAVQAYRTPAGASVPNTTLGTWLGIDTNNAWEIWQGAYTTAGTSIARTTLLSSSSGGSITFTANAVFSMICGAFDLNNLADITETNTFTAAQFITLATLGANLSLYTDDAGATGAILDFYHRSPNPAAGNVIAISHYYGRDNAANIHSYAQTWAEIVDTTNGTEEGVFVVGASEAGAIVTSCIFGGGAGVKPRAGTTTRAPMRLTAGTNLTTPVAGSVEFDGIQHYETIDTTSGRGALNVEHFFRLLNAGSTISTIADYFGANSAIPLVASAQYIIEFVCFFLNTTAGTVTWTLLNAAAPTSQNIEYEMTPVTGIKAPAGSAAANLDGQILTDNTAAKALTATGTLTTAVSHYMRLKVWLQNGTGTNVRLQATKNVGGTITPGIGSYWTCRRITAGNVGTFAA